MKTAQVQIKGTAPMLHHKFIDGTIPGSAGVKATRAQVITNESPRVQAEKVVYRDGETFYFPGAAIAAMLRNAGSNHKMKGSRKSVKYLIPAAVIVIDQAITLCNGTGKPIKDFEVDSQPVTIPSTKGKIMRHRPRFDNWSASFNMLIDETLLEPEFIYQLLSEGGTRFGIMDYRPLHGRFQIHSWEILQDI